MIYLGRRACLWLNGTTWGLDVDAGGKQTFTSGLVKNGAGTLRHQLIIAIYYYYYCQVPLLLLPLLLLPFLLLLLVLLLLLLLPTPVSPKLEQVSTDDWPLARRSNISIPVPLANDRYNLPILI